MKQTFIDVEDLAAGADIADRPIFVVPTDKVYLAGIGLLTQDAPAGIDDSNTCIIAIKNSDDKTIVSKTYNAANQPPSGGYASLGSLSNTTLAANVSLLLNVTQGATADMPAFRLVISYYEPVSEAISELTVDNIKTFLRITTTDDDNLLAQLLAQAYDRVESECQRTFLEADYTEYHNGDGTDTVLLDNYPVNSITSLYDDPDRQYGSDTLIDADDYVIYADSGMVVLDGLTFNTGLKNIKITYNAGYSDLPDELIAAIIKLVAADYLEGQGALNAIVGEEALVDKPARLRREARSVIDRYKRRIDA